MRKKGAALRAVQVLRQAQDDREGNDLEPASESAGELVAAGRAPLPAFEPVPRRYRHDGWTPERQKAFIEALADTGCVTRAATMVNMAQANCYALRRAAGAEGFRRAWDAALDFGLKRLKDIAFERAIEGQLVPVFVAGKLLGFRRKRNDALLMFCLRHYGQDAHGKRTTINYFSSRASAGVLRDASSTSSAAPQDERAGAEASTTTVRTVISGDGGDAAGREDEAASVLNGFEGVALDAEAERAIAAALEDCAQRARALEAAYRQGGSAAADAGESDPDEVYFHSDDPYRGELISGIETEDFVDVVPGEARWALAGAEKPAELIAFEERQAQKAKGGLAEEGARG